MSAQLTRASARWLRQGSAALVGAIAVTIFAGVDGAKSRESPLGVGIYREINAIIPVAKSGGASFAEAVIVSNGTPDIQKHVFLGANRFTVDWQSVFASLSHFHVRRDDVIPLQQMLSINQESNVLFVTDSEPDKPFRFRSGKIARVNDFDVSNAFVAVSEHMDASRPDAQIGTLKNSSVSNLATRNNSQNYGERPDYESRNRRNIVMERVNKSVIEPNDITPDAIQHAKALVITAGIFCAFILFVCWWFL